MAYNLLGWEREQGYLMPPLMREWLSEGHLAWFIVDAVEEMCRQGALRRHLTVKIAGGAQMSMASGVNGLFKTGERNAESTREALSREGIVLAAADTGGHHGRTVRMYLDSGRVILSTAGKETREL